MTCAKTRFSGVGRGSQTLYGGPHFLRSRVRKGTGSLLSVRRARDRWSRGRGRQTVVNICAPLRHAIRRGTCLFGAHVYPHPLPRQNGPMPQHRIYTTSVASVYPHWVTKAEKKNRTKDEVDQIICWLTG